MRPICDRPGPPVQHDDKFFFLFVGIGESDIAISKKVYRRAVVGENPERALV